MALNILMSISSDDINFFPFTHTTCLLCLIKLKVHSDRIPGCEFSTFDQNLSTCYIYKCPKANNPNLYPGGAFTGSDYHELCLGHHRTHYVLLDPYAFYLFFVSSNSSPHSAVKKKDILSGVNCPLLASASIVSKSISLSCCLTVYICLRTCVVAFLSHLFDRISSIMCMPPNLEAFHRI